MNQTVAIILVNWKCYSVTACCLRSLQQGTNIENGIIVVDNGSGDGSAELFASHFPGIKLIRSETNLGFAGGNNLGIDYAIQAGYEYIMLLNNDTLVEPGFLEPLVSYMENHPETGVIQPCIYFQHDRSLVWNGGSYFNRWLSTTYVPGYNKRLEAGNKTLKEVDWVTGCAFLTRTSVIRKVGKMDDRFFMYYEDADLSFRIKKAGYRLIYHPESVIYHIAGVSGKKKEKGKEGFIHPIIHYYNLRNRIWMVRKYTGPPYVVTAWLFNFFYIIALMGYFVARLRFTKFRAVLRAVYDGLKGQNN